MDPDNHERKIDAWLHDALARYSSAEPGAGLEKRVLTKLRAEERRPRRRWWMAWAPALALAGAVVVVMLAVYPNRESSPEVVVPSRIVSKQAPAAPPETRGGERQPGTTAARGSDAKAGKSISQDSTAATQEPGAARVVSAFAPAEEPEAAAARNVVASGIKVASPATPILHPASVFPLPAPLSEQERLAIAAIRCGLSPSTKPQIVQGDELLPQVEIREIRIVPLKGLEQS